MEADEGHVWALGIASMPPKVIRLAPDGTCQANYVLPESVRPDGQVYFIASQPDRSVQIQRLRFAPWPRPSKTDVVTPTASPTPLTPLLPAWETPPAGVTQLEIARQTLLAFFADLNDGATPKRPHYTGAATRTSRSSASIQCRKTRSWFGRANARANASC